MLGKLIKYEFKATGKIMLLFYAGLIFMALLNMLIMPWGPTGNFDLFEGALDRTSSTGETLDFMKTLLQGAIFVMYIVLAIAVGLVTLVAIVLRFYKMLGDEGYLMFTLPVNTSSQIISKLIAATVWLICSTIVIILSILIVIGRVDYFDEIADGIRELVGMGLHPGTWFVLITIAIILSMIVGSLEFYLALALGMHITKSRVGGSIIGYIIVYTATQLISTVAMLPMMLSIDVFGTGPLDNLSPVEMEWQIVSTVSIFTFLLLLVTGIVSYFLTHHLLKNKLNLG